VIDMDSFWEENSKLSVEEIEQKFSDKTAAALKMQKESKKAKTNIPFAKA